MIRQQASGLRVGQRVIYNGAVTGIVTANSQDAVTIHWDDLSHPLQIPHDQCDAIELEQPKQKGRYDC